MGIILANLSTSVKNHIMERALPIISRYIFSMLFRKKMIKQGKRILSSVILIEIFLSFMA